MCNRRLWKLMNVSIGVPDEESGGGSLTKTFER